MTEIIRLVFTGSITLIVAGVAFVFWVWIIGTMFGKPEE